MITQKQLKEHLYYNKDTGIMTRLVSKSNAVKIGDVAGSIGGKGYLYTSVLGKKYSNHRLIWLYVNGKFPKKQIDHINQDKTDNRLINLREVSNVENHKNMPKYNNNKSGCTGVRFYQKAWSARIRADGKEIHLGRFKNKEDAVKARREAEIKYEFHKNHGGYNNEI